MDTRYWNYVLLFVLAGSAISAAPARAQALCTNDRLDEANQAYERGQLLETISKLRPCLDHLDMLEEERKVQVLELLTFSYFYRDEPDSSSQMVRRLVRKVDRGYRAQIGDPQFFRALIKQNKIKWYQKRWVHIGSGIVTSGVITYFLTRPKKLTAKPPEPPGK